MTSSGIITYTYTALGSSTVIAPPTARRLLHRDGELSRVGRLHRRVRLGQLHDRPGHADHQRDGLKRHLQRLGLHWLADNDRQRDGDILRHHHLHLYRAGLEHRDRTARARRLLHRDGELPRVGRLHRRVRLGQLHDRPGHADYQRDGLKRHLQRLGLHRLADNDRQRDGDNLRNHLHLHRAGLDHGDRGADARRHVHRDGELRRLGRLHRRVRLGQLHDLRGLDIGRRFDVGRRTSAARPSRRPSRPPEAHPPAPSISTTAPP